MCTVFPTTNKQNHPHAIHPNETVGAVPMCLPERPRSSVSIPKIHALCVGMNGGCALTGRRGRAHRHRPYQSPSYFSTQSHTNKITIYAQSAQMPPTVHAQSAQTTSTIPCAICPNAIRHSRAIHPNEMRRGGACVPARTSAQRRFHTKNTRIVRGELNDGCAPAGRHGRAHRHRPYPFPPNHTVCPYRIAVILSIAQGWQVQRSLPWVTMQARRLPPWGLYFFHHIVF